MLIEESVRARLEVIELKTVEYMHALENVSAKGLTSGIIYDALHLEAAKKSSCSRIYTYNLNHFEVIAPNDLTISSP